MKKLFVFVLAAGYCIAGIAHESYVTWVDSKSGKLDCKRVNIGITNARIILKKSITIVDPYFCKVNQYKFYSLSLLNVEKVHYMVLIVICLYYCIRP